MKYWKSRLNDAMVEVMSFALIVAITALALAGAIASVNLLLDVMGGFLH